MAMEIHVLFRGKLPSKAALQSALRELGFPFSIKPATGSLERQDGFMPMLLAREETGAEFDVFEGRAAVEEIGGKDVDARFDRVANFRWGGDMRECASAVCGAAALAKLVDGVVLEEEEGKLLSVDEAIEIARQVFSKVPKRSTPTARPRRPDLTCVLKPLLDKRSDLVLLEDRLAITPVRHLLRGATIRWSPKSASWNVYRFVQPLFQETGIFSGEIVFTVWGGDPDAQAMLLDGLAGDVFPAVGRIASLDDLLDAMRAEQFGPKFLRVTMLLTGGNEQAREYVTKCEQENQLPGQSGGTLLWLAGEREKGFAEYHEREAEAARRFKIESIWKPSPFPAEETENGRGTSASDPSFALTPWPEYSTSWRHDPPTEPGATCFADSWLTRGSRPFLKTPLPRDEAERRHRNYDPYFLAARLPEGPLMIFSIFVAGGAVRRSDGSIDEGQPMPLKTYGITVYGSRGRVLGSQFHEEFDQRGILRMQNINIRQHDGSGGYIWYSHINVAEGYKIIHDYRGNQHTNTRRPVTDTDRSCCLLPVPAFGEFNIFWNCISTYIENEGFGAFE
jgi:hypothetical protein